MNQCASGKTRKFGPPPPYAPIGCRRFEPSFWSEIITVSDIQRKINFINEVLLLQNPFILMKSSVYSPLLQTTSLYELPFIFKRKSWASPFYDFSKISTSHVNKEFHTVVPQSIFALTFLKYTTLISIIKYIIAKN